MSHNNHNTFDTALVEAADALFDNQPPGIAAYFDTEPVTVEMTKGQAYSLRSALRALASQNLQNVALIEHGLVEAATEQVTDTTTALQNCVDVDVVLAAVAPVSDYPISEHEREVFGMPADEPALV